MTADDDPWAEYADEWDSDEGARAYARSAHDHLAGLLAEHGGPELDGAVICDFGCGTGLLTELLVDRAAHIDAVDTSPAMLRELWTKMADRGWEHVSASDELPATAGEHDLIVCSSVLSFVDDLDATVRDLARLLRPGGAIVHWDWERTDEHDHGLTRDGARDALVGAGLVDVRIDAAFRFQVEGEEVWPIVGVGWRPPTSDGADRST
ncbi:MAG: class I SAM-dependent methyltransferase [Actinomycetota bacterium]